MQYNWPKNLDTTQSTTYKSQGVHKNRDNTAKLQVEAKNRDGQTDAQMAEARRAAASATEKNISNMGVDEKVGAVRKGSMGQEERITKAGHKGTHDFTETVEPGQFAWWPTPMQGTQASYGDGAAVQGNPQNSELYNAALSGAASGAAQGYASGGGQGAASGAGQGAMGGAMGAMSGQLGQDIASKDDSIDQATEALFQDDSDVEGHFALAEKLQGR